MARAHRFSNEYRRTSMLIPAIPAARVTVPRKTKGGTSHEASEHHVPWGGNSVKSPSSHEMSRLMAVKKSVASCGASLPSQVRRHSWPLGSSVSLSRTKGAQVPSFSRKSAGPVKFICAKSSPRLQDLGSRQYRRRLDLCFGSRRYLSSHWQSSTLDPSPPTVRELFGHGRQEIRSRAAVRLANSVWLQVQSFGDALPGEDVLAPLGQGWQE
mmetsp:Transcript_113964/g.322644  ORF Transcript_113964/g.322644 Transcript_113964/m.322644 type:complete len:212 (+) Transcript_113964:181-816(+)